MIQTILEVALALIALPLLFIAGLFIVASPLILYELLQSAEEPENNATTSWG